MKHESRQPKYNRHYRWGLTVALFAAVGFSLSMNPQHFNNIARVYKDAEFANYASTETPLLVTVDGKDYAATVTRPANLEETDTRVLVRISADNKEFCYELCDKIVPLKPVGNGIPDITKAIEQLIAGKKAEKAKPVAEEAKPANSKEAAIKAAEELIAQKQTECEDKSKQTRNSCFAKALVELSSAFEGKAKPEFKDLPQKGSDLLTDFFDDNLKKTMIAAFNAKIQYNKADALDLAWGVTSPAELFEESAYGKTIELSDLLISRLKENGDEIREMIFQIESASIRRQVKHAQQDVIAGIRDPMSGRFQAGYNDLKAWGQIYQDRAYDITGLIDRMDESVALSFENAYVNPNDKFFLEIVKQWGAFEKLNLDTLVTTQGGSAPGSGVRARLPRVGPGLSNDNLYASLSGLSGSPNGQQTVTNQHPLQQQQLSRPNPVDLRSKGRTSRIINP